MTALDHNTPLTAERLAEIRDRVNKAIAGPYEVERESCECEYPCGHESWPYAFRLSVPHAADKNGQSHYYDYLYSEVSQLGEETVEFLAASRQDVEDLLAEVDRLNKHIAAYDRMNQVVDSDWQREVARLKADLAVMGERYDAQKNRADQSANRTRGLMRYAIRRVGELGQIRDAVALDGDAQRADRLSFAMQEIRDVFKREHTEEEGPFEEMDRLKVERDQARETAQHMASAMTKVGPAIQRAMRLIAAGDAAGAAAVLGDVAPEAPEGGETP